MAKEFKKQPQQKNVSGTNVAPHKQREQQAAKPENTTRPNQKEANQANWQQKQAFKNKADHAGKSFSKRNEEQE